MPVHDDRQPTLSTAMHLEGSDGQSIELRILGYELPDRTSDRAEIGQLDAGAVEQILDLRHQIATASDGGGDQADLDASQQLQKGQQFGGFAAVGDRQDDIPGDDHADVGEDQSYGPDGYGIILHTCAACGHAGEFAVEWPCWERKLIDEALA